MAPPASTAKFGLLLIIATVTALSLPSLAADAETCYSRQHQSASVDVRATMSKNTTAMARKAVQSERQCVLACCSQEVHSGSRCNMAVFNGITAAGEENCFLFYCSSEQDCPLMKVQDKINTYDIYKGLIQPPILKPVSTTTAVAPPTTTTTPTTIALTSPPASKKPNKTTKKQNKTTRKGKLRPVSPDQSAIGPTHSLKEAEPKTTQAAKLQFISPPTTPGTATNAPSTTSKPTTEPSTVSRTIPTTVLNIVPEDTPPSDPAHPDQSDHSFELDHIGRLDQPDRPPLSDPAAETDNQDPPQHHQPSHALHSDPSAQPTVAKEDHVPYVDPTPETDLSFRAPPTHDEPNPETDPKPDRSPPLDSVPKQNDVPNLDSAPITDHPLSSAGLAPQTDNPRLDPVPKQDDAPILHPSPQTEHSFHVDLVSQAEQSPHLDFVPQTDHDPHLEPVLEPDHSLHLDPISQQDHVPYVDPAPKMDLSSNSDFPHLPDRPLMSDHAPRAPGSDQVKAVATQGALRSGVVAFTVLGIIVITLALAIGGRKAMESFDRRHYTRLELNDLHYEV